MPISSAHRRYMIVAWLLILTVGCGDDQLPLERVRGVVYYRGTPLHGGSIVFAPDADRGNHGPLARAEIQTDGSYLLRTGDDVGAVAGWHRVTVIAVEPTTANAAGEFMDVRSLLPPQYSDPKLSKLQCEVKPKRENILDIHLD